MNPTYTPDSDINTTWATPQSFFDALNAQFHFTLDVAALPTTAKCARFFTPEIDAMTQDWTRGVLDESALRARGERLRMGAEGV